MFRSCANRLKRTEGVETCRTTLAVRRDESGLCKSRRSSESVDKARADTFEQPHDTAQPLNTLEIRLPPYPRAAACIALVLLLVSVVDA